MKELVNLFKDKSGAVAAEYAFLAVLIAMVIIGAVSLIGADVNTMIGSFTAQLAEST